MMFLGSPAHLDQGGAVRCGLPAGVRCRPFIAALIVLDPEAAVAFAAQHGIADLTPAILAEHPAIRAAVPATAGTANAPLSRVEQIKRSAILPVS